MAETDGLLGRFIKERSDEAFRALVERHGAMVHATCRRVLGGEAESEDGAQAVFFILSRKAESVANEQALGAWLHRVAVRVACEMKRKRKVRERHEDIAAVEKGKAEVERPSEAEMAKVKAAVDEEIDALPEKLRMAVLACLVDEKPVAQAAKELGLTDGQVRGRLERAREKLRAALLGRGIGIAPAVLPMVLGEVLAKDPVLAAGLAQKLVLAGSGAVSGGVSGPGAALSPAVVNVAEAVTAQLVKAKLLQGLMAVFAAGAVITAGSLGVAWAMDPGVDGGRVSGPPSAYSGVLPDRGAAVTTASFPAMVPAARAAGVSPATMPAPAGTRRVTNSLRGQTRRGASVEVMRYLGVELKTGAEKPGAETLPHGWLRLPGFLSQGATIYSLEAKHSEAEGEQEAGVLKFRVKSDGVVVILCAYGYQGNAQGGWTRDVKSAEALIDEGWEPVGMAVSRYGREFTAFAREVKAGDWFRIRCNKYEPPYVVVKDSMSFAREVESEFPSARPKATAPKAQAAVNSWTVGRVWGMSPVRLPAGGWLEMPEEVRGGQIFSREGDGDEPDTHHGGAADFEVQRAGVVFIAGQLDLRDGTLEGDWDEHRLTVKNFEEAGWAFVGSMKNDKGVSYAVFRKTVLRGERYRVRTNKYTPAYVIVKP